MPNFFFVLPSLVPALEAGNEKIQQPLTIHAAAETAPPFPNRRVIGTWVEIRFALDAIEHGLVVAKPYTDESFDCFAMPRAEAGLGTKRKKIVTVQVRSAHNRAQPHQLEFTIPLTHGHPRRPYQPGDFDLLAAYVGPYKTWYIIPFPEIAGRSGIHFYTHNPASTGQFEKFKERWDLLGGTRFPPNRHNEGA